MRIDRQFEKRGPLYVPRYTPVPGERYQRYRKRQRFSLAPAVQNYELFIGQNTGQWKTNSYNQASGHFAPKAKPASPGKRNSMK